MFNEKTNGQRKYKCSIIGCKENGRILANIGGIPITYCPKHRKIYGERIIDALINSVFNYKLTNFLLKVKSDIFMDKDFMCTECAKKLNDYIINKTNELEGILDYADKNNIKNVKTDNIR